MFRWSSQALAQYGSGHILVVADTVDEAREKALVAFKTWVREYRSWLFDVASGEIYPEEQEEYNTLITTFCNDISKEPTVETVLLIRGSE